MPRLIVRRTELREALKYLKRFVRPKKPGEACIALDSGVLII